MKIIKILSIVFPLVSALGCSSIKPEKSQTRDETQLVDALLRIEFSHCVASNFPFVIQEELGIFEGLIKHRSNDGTLQGYAESLAEEAAGMDKRVVEAVWDFYEKNSRGWKIESLGTLSVEHIVYTQEMNHGIFLKGESLTESWDSFYVEFPNYPGIIALSRAGFSKDSSIAVIYMGNRYGRLMGRGRVHIYKKINGKWIRSEFLFGHQWMS